MVESKRRGDGQRILYGIWLSPYMALVAQVLAESGLAFRYERVSPFVGGTHSDRHKARNPLGKIPSLEDSNGTIVSESQAICRYLARSYPQAQHIYPCSDAVRCAAVDATNDFLTFSISGPFFSWFVIGGYYPKAWRLKTEHESQIFSTWSMLMIRNGLGRLLASSKLSPFLLGSEPTLPDFHLFHVLELGKTFSQLFEMPWLDLKETDGALREFYQAMSSRPSSKEILEAQAAELPDTRRELFEDFGPAYAEMLEPARPVLQALFGHEV